MRIIIVGLGAIGGFLLKELAGDPEFEIAGICEIDSQLAHCRLSELSLPGTLLKDLDDLPDDTDIYIEVAGAMVARKVAELALSRGKTAVIASIGALGDISDLTKLAYSKGGKLILPSGAIVGLDGLKAIPPESIKSVKLISTKPLRNFVNIAYLEKKGINVKKIKEPTRIFTGSAREAAKNFPKSANVAATLGYASIGLDRVEVEIWADPESELNRHRITIESGHGTITTEVANTQFEINPKTSKLAAYSILATIKNLASPVIIGT